MRDIIIIIPGSNSEKKIENKTKRGMGLNCMLDIKKKKRKITKNTFSRCLACFFFVFFFCYVIRTAILVVVCPALSKEGGGT